MLFVRYLIFLCALIALTITVLWLTANGTIWRSLGVVLNVCLLQATVVVLYCFNRQIWLIWVEDGCVYCKSILTGRHICFKPEHVRSVGITYDNKHIFFISSEKEFHHAGLTVMLENSEANLELIRTFWSGDIW